MRLTPRDKKVIESFLAKRPMVSKKLSTNGKILNKNAQLYSHFEIGVAEWKGSHIKQVSDDPQKLATIVNYMTKEALRRGISVFDFWGREKKLKAITFNPKDKKVIESFIAKKPARSRKLSTNGHLLECLLTNVVLFHHDVSGYYIIRNWKSHKLNRIHLFWTTVSNMVVKNARHNVVLSSQEYEEMKKESMGILEASLIEFNELRGSNKKPSRKHLQEVWDSGLIDEEIRRVEEAISDYTHYMTDVEFQ